jgi:hypothetical protein
MVYAVLAALGVLTCARLSAGLVVARRAGPHEDTSDRSQSGSAGGRSAGRGGKRSVTVSVVVPAINEAESIGWVLARIPSWVTEVVLVDGRSVDATEIVASDLVPDLVIVHQPQPGKGAALRAGFAAASGDIIVTLDADGSINPDELHLFVRALEAGAEFVKGSRHLPAGGSEDLTWLRMLGNRALVRLTNLLYGCRFTDLCYGYCGFWRRDLPALRLSADGFEIETELIIRAVEIGLKITEIPSIELNRLAGASNLNAFRDGARVLRTILTERARRGSGRSHLRTEVDLWPVIIPIPGSRGWLPAGIENDRRRQADRRPGCDGLGYIGPDRRQSERRKQHGVTTVYRAIEREVALGPLPPPSDAGAVKPIAPEALAATEVTS